MEGFPLISLILLYFLFCYVLIGSIRILNTEIIKIIVTLTINVRNVVFRSKN